MTFNKASSSFTITVVLRTGESELILQVEPELLVHSYFPPSPLTLWYPSIVIVWASWSIHTLWGYVPVYWMGFPELSPSDRASMLSSLRTFMVEELFAYNARPIENITIDDKTINFFFIICNFLIINFINVFLRKRIIFKPSFCRIKANNKLCFPATITSVPWTLE